MANIEVHHEYESFAAKIRGARIRAELSQDDLACLLDRERVWVSHLESARLVPANREMTFKIARVLSLDPDLLWVEVVKLRTRPDEREVWERLIAEARIEPTALDPAEQALLADLRAAGEQGGNPVALTAMLADLLRAWRFAADKSIARSMGFRAGEPVLTRAIGLIGLLKIVADVDMHIRDGFVRALVDLAHAFIGAAITADPKKAMLLTDASAAWVREHLGLDPLPPGDSDE